MISKNLLIANEKNPRNPFNVLVQGNKNYGICDIVLPGKPIKPVFPHVQTEETIKKYIESKTIYDSETKRLTNLRSKILNTFMGRQLNSSDTRTHLCNVLYYELNAD